MLARNALLLARLPSISTPTNVGARIWSRALMSLASMARFQACSRAMMRPVSSLDEFCANTGKTVRSKSAAIRKGLVMESSAPGCSFRGDQRGGAGHALPALVALNPGVNKTFTVNVRLALFDALNAKDTDNDGRVAVNLNAHIFVDCLRRLIFGRL